MAWSIGAVSVHIDEMSGNDEAVIGEQHVLDALATTKHYSGAQGLKLNVSGTLYTSGSTSSELFTLLGYKDASAAQAVTTDQGSFGSFYVKSVEFERKQALNRTYPVYRVRVGLLGA